MEEDTSMWNSGRTRKFRRHYRFYYILPCFYIFLSLLAVIVSKLNLGNSRSVSTSISYNSGRHVLQSADDDDVECVPPSIDSFPGDFFTQEQRMKGGVVVHVIILLYLCAMLAIVCDDYFVPSLEIISAKMQLQPDVAGATFMAIGTSAPEFFASVIGSFITDSDIGIGTIVGSAVFNILGVTGITGLVFWSKEIPIDWYPIMRDSSVYVVTIAALTIVISDNYVYWYEALILLVMFGMYVVLMYGNRAVEKFTKKQVQRIRDNWQNCCCCCVQSEETTPLLGSDPYVPEIKEAVRQQSIVGIRDSFSVDLGKAAKVKRRQSEILVEEEEEMIILEAEHASEGSLCSPPGGFWKILWWLITWPATLLFTVTMPDMRRERWKKCFVVTFLISTVWLGVLSYVATWMVTIIGYTFSIPDTVSGLTLLAVGTSLPEVVSSIVVTRNGEGNMMMSNLIGSNIFDILFCLGVPWFIKTLSTDGFLVINSSGLTYTTTTLLTTVLVLLVIFHVSGWKLNRLVGLACIFVYIIFVGLACLYELNVFGYLNPPTC